MRALRIPGLSRWLRPRLAVALLLLGLAVALLGVEWLVGPVLLIGGLFLLLRYAMGPLSKRIAGIRVGIRWKLLTGIVLMALPFLVVSLVNFGAMDYMHDELHRIQGLRDSDPRLARAALDALERAQHSPLFSRTLFIGSLVALAVLGFGVAIGLAVTEPLRQIAQAMRRVAAGDFSQPIRVANRDELGELADRINRTMQELTRLQQEALSAERARGLRERIAQVTLAQEEERRRISRELHDGLGPSLAALANRLRACQQIVRADPERVEREMEEVSRSLKEQIQSIRELTYNLRPMVLDQLGLISALRQHVERFGQETAVKVSLSVPAPVDLEPLAEVTVFRVVQECLNNIQKHAEATRVEIRLSYADAGLTVSIEDNGRGFDPSGPPSGAGDNGLGLLSMCERAELLGGSVLVHSSPGRGCRVTLSIPVLGANVGAR